LLFQQSLTVLIKLVCYLFDLKDAIVFFANNEMIDTAGFVDYMEDDILAIYNCDAIVSMNEEEPAKIYRIGREGKVDIKFTKPAQTRYFEDHLPRIRKGISF
jgi:hypothetical protein